MTRYAMYIVTGAPGSGKSTALAAFLRRRRHYIAFDIDWLAAPASQLVGKDIRCAPATWKPYNALWFKIVRAIHTNRMTSVLFAPLDERDLQRQDVPAWCTAIHWFLLDCTDDIRRQRLLQRPGWTDAMIEDAISDARFLRATVGHQIDTGTSALDEVAHAIVQWLQSTS